MNIVERLRCLGYTDHKHQPDFNEMAEKLEEH